MRYLELDVTRGIAVLLMIAYHFVFDIIFFQNYNLSNVYLLALPIASSFILISGMVLSISYSKDESFAKFAKRGVKLLLLGMVITAATFIFLKEGFIIFGILHFFGLTSFLIYPFLKYVKNNLLFLIFGILIILAGIFIWGIVYENSYLIWLGLKPADFFSLDYFPLLPWLGVLLLGVFLGRNFYPKGKKNFKIFELKGKSVNILSFLGRNSLIIYFFHQPIIIVILFLLGMTNLSFIGV